MSTTDSPEQLEPQTNSEDLTTPAIATEPEHSSLLLKLPPELRNRIYELAIEGKPRIVSLRRRKVPKWRLANEQTVRLTAEYGTFEREPALLSVCRAVRSEAMELFLAIRPCKIVLFAYSCDGPEIDYREEQLLRLFAGLGPVANAFPAETDSPNFATWERAIRWLADAQTGLLDGGFDRKLWEDFESEQTLIQCAIFELAGRKPRTKPWDVVESAYIHFNLLLFGAKPSSKEDGWMEM